MSNTNNPVQLFSELLGGPLGELISSVGQGVGDAQAALDHGALQQTMDIYDISKDADRSTEELQLVNLIREMGYQPTFYSLPNTEVEAQISLSLDLKSDPNPPATGASFSKFKVNATPLNAGNMNRYGLQSNAMAKLKFSIVPVPPPPGSADLRLVPDFMDYTWGENIKDTLQRLGFVYELRNDEDELITDEETLVGSYTVYDQNPVAGTISKAGNTIVLKITETVVS